MERTILHCDCNSFFASVECVYRPELWDVPMAVCGDPANRHGIVLAKNELAKRYGIVTAETVWQALRKCPNLQLVPPHHDRYEEFYRKINAIYCEYTDMVEPFSIDESWLDVTASRRLFGDGKTIADTLRRRVKEELGITISVGVSFNKVFAKMGSDYKKPDATTVITRDNFRELLYPLPVTELLFVGKSAAATLSRMGIRTIGELAASDRTCLEAALGKIGGTMYEYANALDTEPVRLFTDRPLPKSVGNGTTFRQDLTTEQEVKSGLLQLVEPVGARLRSLGLRCQTLQITLKYPSLQSITRSRKLSSPTYLSAELYTAACELLSAHWREGIALRSLTVTATSLTADGAGNQLSLFEEETAVQRRDKQETLENTVDRLREKYGNESVQRLSILKNE